MSQPIIKRLFGEFPSLKDKENRELLCMSISDNRTASIRDLKQGELLLLEQRLKEAAEKAKASAATQSDIEARSQAAVKKMRAKCLYIATNVGLIDKVPRGEKADFTRFNAWMLNNTKAKKQMWDYTENDLPSLIDQLEAYQRSLMQRTGKAAPTTNDNPSHVEEKQP